MVSGNGRRIVWYKFHDILKERCDILMMET